MERTNSHILVQGPAWGEAGFYGRWLLAGANANRLWKRARSDLKFAKRVDRLEITRILDFGVGATAFVMQLREQRYSFVVELLSDDGEEFAIMAEMGFFNWTGHHYHMVVPPRLSMQTVKDAVLRLAATEDAECSLHPEHLVKGMSLLEAAGWQQWLREIHEDSLNSNAN
jgi:hypothetical protein